MGDGEGGSSRRPRTHSWCRRAMERRSATMKPLFIDLTGKESPDEVENVQENTDGVAEADEQLEEEGWVADNPHGPAIKTPLAPYEERPSDGEDDDLDWELGALVERIRRRDQRRFDRKAWQLNRKISMPQQVKAAGIELEKVKAAEIEPDTASSGKVGEPEMELMPSHGVIPYSMHETRDARHYRFKLPKSDSPKLPKMLEPLTVSVENNALVVRAGENPEVQGMHIAYSVFDNFGSPSVGGVVGKFELSSDEYIYKTDEMVVGEMKDYFMNVMIPRVKKEVVERPGVINVNID